MLAFSPQNWGGMGNHITHPVSGPGKPLFTRFFQVLNVHMPPSVGAYIPAAACALRPPCRCWSRRPVCPAGGIVSRRRRRPAAPLYGRDRTRPAPAPGQGAKPPPGNSGNMRLSTTYSACSTHSPAGGSRIPRHSWRTIFLPAFGWPHARHGSAPGRPQLSPRTSGQVGPKSSGFSAAGSRSLRRPSRSSRGKRRRGSRAGALACFPEQAGGSPSSAVPAGCR
jgi:hypothetical protein